MIELFLCSLVTVIPDFLFRRYAQGKRWGHEINFYSVWFELRWGITACVLLTISLVTVIFYYHPSTTKVSSFYRTVTILSEGSGRVAEVLVQNNQLVEAGDILFRLDDSQQRAAVETAGRKIVEIDAEMAVANSDRAAAAGMVQQANSSLNQDVEELATKIELRKRNASTVSERQIERLQISVEGLRGSLEAAEAQLAAIDARISTVFPAQKASAEAWLAESKVALSKMVVYAGVKGRVQQFFLQPGDLVNPILRPAGILVPFENEASGRGRLLAGFGQISAQEIKRGMAAEVTCVSDPFKVIPMVVVGVQDVIAAGQYRPSDQLIDIQERARPGTLTVILEPLYEGQLSSVLPGSKCIANAYTSNHDRLASENLGPLKALFLHAVDAVGLVHAIILRIQTLVLPIQTLVFSGH